MGNLLPHLLLVFAVAVAPLLVLPSLRQAVVPLRVAPPGQRLQLVVARQFARLFLPLPAALLLTVLAVPAGADPRCGRGLVVLVRPALFAVLLPLPFLLAIQVAAGR